MSEAITYLIQITGLVQGVGMRPFIYRTAKTWDLTGFVRNKGASVLITVSGKEQAIDHFLFELTSGAPENSRIDHIEKKVSDSSDFEEFRIIDSLEDTTCQGMILPDLAVCDECLKDIKSSKDKRFGYAFTNCTNCGPRYSIINDLPYDRVNTAMKPFAMCDECAGEYHNPVSRRFHAQPNCCPDCGPQYYFLDSSGIRIICEDVVQKAKQLLKKGKILAIKGIGGYHLVCNAQDENAVRILREKKNRPHRPFAIMSADIDRVREICKLNAYEEKVLSNNKRPIVLLDKSNDSILPEIIAPHLKSYGVMLPYTPLHYFLFDNELQYLVMTSGNISTMPICYKDQDAFEHLSQIADYFLVHDREIITPIDDSVVKVLDDDLMISRCGRGYAPMALPVDTSKEILALGGEQKASVCVVHKGMAHISQYLGQLDTLQACNEYIKASDRLSYLLKADTQFAAHDLHPNYFSTQYAKKTSKTLIPVQHHHAHMAGCMAEHDLTGDVIGIVFDGTGMGTDGTIWGGEFLIGSTSAFHRAAHLEYVTLQGADSAIKAPWKCAVSYLQALNEDISEFFSDIEKSELEAIKRSLQYKVNCYDSSGMGRLFDCIGALVLHRTHISYDAQAAIELESLTDNAVADSYKFSIYENCAEGTLILGYKKIIKGVLTDLRVGLAESVIASKFHNAVCEMTATCAVMLRDKYKINNVVLSGGVFENTYLLKHIKTALKSSGFEVYYNKLVPLNDGGLSFGQAAVAASMLEEGAYVSGNSCKNHIYGR